MCGHGHARVFSELGCLPVSAMTHIPTAREILDEDGAWISDAAKWDGYARAPSGK
jgi:hypothetical protein